jgi:POT family proton-dependent oligopeptide transporter
MGINTGSILGQFVVPLVGEKINWHWGFGLAAVGMFFGLLQFRLSQDTLLNLGIKPKAKERQEEGGEITGNKGMAIGLVIALIAFLVVLQYVNVIDLTSAGGIAAGAGVLIVSITLFYFLYILIAGGLNGEEKRRVGIIFFLFIGAALFWAGFEQAGSTLNLFSRDYTNRFLFGWELPAGWLQNVNPLMIVIFAPIIGALWVKLAAKNLNPATPLKFGLGLILMGFGFLVMYFAAHRVVEGMQAGMAWLVLTYFLHSAGELALSPVGLSATTKLAPKAFVGQMMGIWFVATSLGNLIAGMFAGEFDPNNVSGMPSLFMTVVLFGCGSGILFVIFSPLMKKWMGNFQ